MEGHLFRPILVYHRINEGMDHPFVHRAINRSIYCGVDRSMILSECTEYGPYCSSKFVIGTFGTHALLEGI